jgi:hypothetical protein
MVDLLDIHQAELQLVVTQSYCNYNTSLLRTMITLEGRGHTKETGNRNATAISRNFADFKQATGFQTGRHILRKFMFD